MTLTETPAPASAAAADAPAPRYYAYVDDRPDLIARAGVIVLLAGTAVLYLWGLSASGYANAFYSAAAQAGSANLEAWFFGSLDGGNSITVDKPPAAIWLMALSVRLFGLSSWSILVPQALLGVASVGVLYATLRRTLLAQRGSPGATHPLTPRTAHWAALAGAAVFALTPVATLMFRFNNPDALLVFSLVLAGYFTVRAAENASRGWLALAGVAVGLGFLTKMLQAFLVLPALVVAYAVAAPAPWRKRIVDLLVAFAAVELIVSYNGLGRITGEEIGSVGGGRWGSTGLTRLFEGVSGGMVSWLIPAALVLGLSALGVAVAELRGAPAPGGDERRTPARALASGAVIWVGWLVVTGLVFSLMAGIYHDYYTVALAPAIGGAVALGGAVLWARRGRLVPRLVLAAPTAGTGAWAVVLLQQAGGWYSALGWVVLALSVLAAAGLAVADRVPRVVASLAVGTAVIAALAGPYAYSVNTAAT
ncbi:MAG: glycosyltransferase family 39 protein, partial [Actinobacteria bacterium]|nr:glycosyltransferase family 39 protein [Actinomycetota bacterium]